MYEHNKGVIGVLQYAQYVRETQIDSSVTYV